MSLSTTSAHRSGGSGGSGGSRGSASRRARGGRLPALSGTRSVVLLVALFVSGLLVPGTALPQETEPQKTEPQETGAEEHAGEEGVEETPYQDSVDAHRAYLAGDCARVLEETDPETLSSWPSTDILWSTTLLRGYCLELEGRPKEAREVYEAVRIQGLGFHASLDASDRLLFMDRVERDPGYAEWAGQAKLRADPSRKGRAPVERENPVYPPVPQALSVEGWVVVEFGVNPGGETVQPVVAESRPPLLFDGSALRAVRGWKFKRRSGKGAGDRQVIRFVFKRGSEDG